jgi:hypothetical protein
LKIRQFDVLHTDSIPPANPRVLTFDPLQTFRLP